MRPVYVIILLGIKFLIFDESNFWIFDIIFEIFPLLWTFALLSSVFVTLMYLIEKWNLLILGSLQSASDLRTIIFGVV